jgi:transporter family-2 protein
MIYAVAILVGMISALQSTMNRQIAASWGLTSTLVVTGISMLVSVCLLYVWVRMSPTTFPDFFEDKTPWTNFKLWYVIPGVLGLLIVLGFPFAISKIGATSVFLLAIVGQITMSVLWDVFVEKIPMNHYRLIAVALCAMGAYLSTKST